MRAAIHTQPTTAVVVPDPKQTQVLAATWAAQTGRPINALGLVVKP